MTSEERSRAALYHRLTEVIGDEHAMTLFRYLPTEGARLATRDDIARLESRMDGLDERMDGLDERMYRFEQRMDGFHGRLDGLQEALREQGRTFTVAMVRAVVGSVVTVGGLAFAAARLI